MTGKLLQLCSQGVRTHIRRPYNDGDNPEYIFDSYVYRVQISDAGFSEVTDSSGISGSTQ